MGKAITSSVAVVLVATAVSVAAQTKVIQGEMKSVTATVEAIEQSTREVTVRKPDGTDVTFYVPASMKRFDQLKVGDKIHAKYYDNIVVQVKEPGAADVNEAKGSLVPVAGAPAGTMSYQRTITATITAIDPKTPSITFTGPNGWKVQQPRRGSRGIVEGESRRQGGHHLDDGVTDVDRRQLSPPTAAADGRALSRTRRRDRCSRIRDTDPARVPYCFAGAALFLIEKSPASSPQPVDCAWPLAVDRSGAIVAVTVTRPVHGWS